MITIDMVKQAVIDAKKVTDKAEAASYRAMQRFGAFVMVRAKTSIRKRKGISPAGSPPSSHVGLIRDHMAFVVERMPPNVVIGPMKLNGMRSETAMSALEHGGPTLIMRHGKPKSIELAAHPFMQPAFEIEIEKAPKLWENSLRG